MSGIRRSLTDAPFAASSTLEGFPPAHISTDDGSTAFRAFLSCPFMYRAYHAAGGKLQRRLSEDDPIDLGQVVHYALMLAWLSVKDAQEKKKPRWPVPVASTLRAMEAGMVPELTDDGIDRMRKMCQGGLPVLSQAHLLPKVLAVEAKMSLACGQYEVGGATSEAFYRPTLDLLLQDRGGLIFSDHKTSAIRCTPLIMDLFAADIQFVGMSALGAYGGWLECDACDGQGCARCDGGMIWIPPQPSRMMVNYIGSRPPFGVRMEPVEISLSRRRGFKESIRWAAQARADLWRREKAGEITADQWPRTMANYGACFSKFGTGKCSYYDRCFEGIIDGPTYGG